MTQSVVDFIRTPFAVRCNVVKVWRPLPQNIWDQLSSPADVLQSRQWERRALFGIAIMVVILVAGFSNVGYRTHVANIVVSYPLLGASFASTGESHLTSGWFYAPGLSIRFALWTVVPPLVVWMMVRSIWIPMVAAGRPTRDATLAFARHLSGVYLYVYLMIVLGAALMPVLIQFDPVRTETLRWCLRWFLFGESFFVPALMWLRLVGNDASGQVFGRSRCAILVAYGAVIVVIPIMGMG